MVVSLNPWHGTSMGEGKTNDRFRVDLWPPLGPVLNKNSLGFGILYIDVYDRNLFRRRWAAHVFYGYTPSYSDTTAHPYLSSGPQLVVYTGNKNRGVMRAYEKHTPTTPEPG